MSDGVVQFRPAEAIERDLMDVRASALPSEIAENKFERLWDEANDAAACLLPSEGGVAYLKLLKRLQDEFDRLRMNAYLARISKIRWEPRW